MIIKEVVPSLYTFSLGVSNAFLIESDDGLILVDTGLPGNAGKIVQAVQELGKRPHDIRHILVTHCHTDHAGSLAAIKKITGASAYMHPADAAMVTQGRPQRPVKPPPGFLSPLLYRLFWHSEPVEPTEIEHEIQDDATLALAGGIEAVHVPGHCAGQLAFFWPQHGNVLFAADTIGNMVGLGWSIGYEDFVEGKRSLAKLAQRDFAVACFGHGNAIVHEASHKFRAKWGTQL